MVVKKTLDAFLGLELVPGVKAPSTVQRYALLTPASTPDSAAETQERTAGWGAPPYPGALIPLDTRGGLESPCADDVGQGPPLPSVELPTLLFRADTDHSVPGSYAAAAAAADDSLQYAATAQAYGWRK